MKATMTIDEMRETLDEGNVGVIMVGCSGSGKSTLARKIAPLDKNAIVSTDEMREKITGDTSHQKCSKYAFELAHKLWEARLRFRQTTIFDATSTTPRSRLALLNLTNEWNKVIMILVAEELETCKERNASRQRVVPEHVIDRQMSQLQDNITTLFDAGIDVDFDCYHYTSDTGIFAKMQAG